MLSVFFLATAFFSQQSLAASQDECAIWLCVPTGFPSGCSSAKSAMIDRIKHFKSPLPSLSSCVVSAPGIQAVQTEELSGVGGKAALIAGTGYVDAHFVKDTRCVVRHKTGDGTTRSPENCVSGSYYYAEVYLNGVKTGETYYFNSNGNSPI